MTGVLPRSTQVENHARQALTGLALRPSDTQLQELAASHHIPLEALAAARWALFDQASGAVAQAGDRSRALREATSEHQTRAGFEGIHTPAPGAVTNAYALRLQAGKGPNPGALDRGITAARGGNVAELQAWLRAHGDIHARDANGLTVVHHAAVANRPDALKLLLDALALDPRRDATLLPPPTANLPSPLQLAAQGNAVDTTRMLLDAEPRLMNHVWGLNGHTALVEAAFNNNADIVALLLAHQGTPAVDTLAVTVRGFTASDLAARAAGQDPRAQRALDLLNAHNAALGLGNVAAAGQPARFDHAPPVKQERLAQVLGAIEPTPRGSSAEYDALIAITQRAPPPVPPGTPPEAAAAQRAAFEATLLADFTAALDGPGAATINLNALGQAMGTTPLIEASVRGYTSVVDLLLKRGADPLVHEEHPMGITGLFKAAVFGFTDAARLQLEAIRGRQPHNLATAVNEQGAANGLTPLHDAILRAQLPVAELLLSFGARADIQSHAGQTAAQLAATNPSVRQRVAQDAAAYPNLARLLGVTTGA